MAIYTGKGDYGKTSIFGGASISKGSHYIAVFGTLDELSSHLGLCRAYSESDYELSSIIKEIQNDIYHIAGGITGAGKRIDPSRTAYLESLIDKYSENIKPLKTFILPGGTKLAAHIHVARAVCRRAERKLAVVYENEGRFLEELRYLNRLSDLLFVLARRSNARSGQKEDVAR